MLEIEIGLDNVEYALRRGSFLTMGANAPQAHALYLVNKIPPQENHYDKIEQLLAELAG